MSPSDTNLKTAELDRIQ